MWFKNAIIYRFSEPFSIGSDELQEKLEPLRFTPCLSGDLSSYGFSNPLGELSDKLTHFVADAHLVQTRKEEKILPASVVKRKVEERVNEIEREEGRKLRKSEKDEIKENIIAVMLPQAFSKMSACEAIILEKSQLIIVNSSSHSKAEELLSLLRKALGSLKVMPLQFSENLETRFTQWLHNPHIIEELQLAQEAELKDPASDAMVKFKNQPLDEPEVLAHLDNGMLVHQIGLNWLEHASFMIDAEAKIKRLKFDDEIKGANSDLDSDDKLARIDADLHLMKAELEALSGTLIPQLGELI